jgi:hypothetical protein
VHTFWNPSKTEPVRARVTHGGRFERLIAQPSFLAMIVYGCYVDPGASRPSHPMMRAMSRVLAWFGKMRGIRLVLDHG